ncbi:MAG: hypothetical protein ABFS37_02185 [Acidobacteriota bacterium]
MTMAWMVMMVVGGLISLAAFVWLLVIAFRESAVWGLACLFIPLAVVVYALKFWDEAKMPFFGILAGSFLGVFGGVGYSMTSVNLGIEEYSDIGERVAWESPTVDPIEYDQPEDLEGDESGPEAEFSEPDQSVEGVEIVVAPPADRETSDHEDALAILDESDETPPPPRPHRDGTLVPLSELASHQGDRVVIVLNTLERVSAYVVDVANQTVLLRHRVGGGSVTYTIDFEDIKEVRSRRIQ